MATQQDIANRLGVSVTTVSLALRNDPQVSAEMRIQVRAVTQELGYTYRPRKGAQSQAAKIASKTHRDHFYRARIHETVGAIRIIDNKTLSTDSFSTI